MSVPGAVHLACARVADVLGAAPAPEAWTSGSEAQRLRGLTHARRRSQFLAARWLARTLLAQAFGGRAQDWALAAVPDAPPAVIGRPDLFLSISHSGGWTAGAVSLQAVGLDLEAPERARDIAGLTELCCTQAEQALVAASADPAASFHELWTVKEAWLKRRQAWVAPRRLQQLAVAPSAPGSVRTWRGPGWWLALCADDAMPRWWSAEPALAGTWSVQDSHADGSA